MTVKMGAPMPPNPMMPRQPMNPLPPPMPVPPINPNMQFGQQPVGALPAAAGTFPVSANKRKRFGDSLETMLSRPPMVASDQMANMNVFTGQMMNTAARRPVVQMRGGGSVYDAYKSDAFKSYTDSKKNTFAPTTGTPGRAVKTHQEIMDSIRGTSSPGDDKPAPVVVTRDDDYTPTSAELNEQLKDMAAIGMPDLRQDQSNVQMPVAPDIMDQINQMRDDSSASMAMLNKYGVLGEPDDRATILAPGTGGLSSPSTPTGSGMQFGDTPAGSMPSMSFGQQPAGSFPADPNIFISDVFESSPSVQFGDQPAGALPGMSFGQQPVGTLPMDPDFYDPRDDRSGFVDPLEPFGGAGEAINLGIGDPDATQVGSGRGDPNTIPSGGQTGTDEEDDRSFIQKLVDDITAIPGNIARDLRMGIDAGFYRNLDQAEVNLRNAKNPDGTRKYTDAEISKWRKATEITMERNRRQTQGQSTDDDGPISTSVVDPCPPNFKLDPVSGICVPVEEAEEEGSSISLNRARDTEFNELDDIMKRIVKPVDDPVGMQAGGSVGLNRAADNFLAAVGA